MTEASGRRVGGKLALCKENGGLWERSSPSRVAKWLISGGDVALFFGRKGCILSKKRAILSGFKRFLRLFQGRFFVSISLSYIYKIGHNFGI